MILDSERYLSSTDAGSKVRVCNRLLQRTPTDCVCVLLSVIRFLCGMQQYV